MGYGGFGYGEQLVDPRTTWNYIGPISKEERAEKIKLYLEKRKRRTFKRKVKYKGREALANSRVRIKGRFVPKEVQNACVSVFFPFPPFLLPPTIRPSNK